MKNGDFMALFLHNRGNTAACSILPMGWNIAIVLQLFNDGGVEISLFDRVRKGRQLT